MLNKNNLSEDKNASPDGRQSNEQQIDISIQSLIQELPEEKKSVFRSLLLEIRKASWISPLPPPDILRGYNELIPNGAERILQMTEEQAHHIMDLEKIVIPGNLHQGRWGQFLAFFITMFFLLSATFLIWQGHDTAGTILGSVNLIALISLFIYGNKAQIHET